MVVCIISNDKGIAVVKANEITETTFYWALFHFLVSYEEPILERIYKDEKEIQLKFLSFFAKK